MWWKKPPVESELIFAQTDLGLGRRRSTRLHSLLLLLSQHVLTAVFGTRHICNNLLENLKLNIRILAFNLHRPVVFQNKNKSFLFIHLITPYILGTSLVCKAHELNVEIDGMRPPQESYILMARESKFRNKTHL